MQTKHFPRLVAGAVFLSTLLQVIPAAASDDPHAAPAKAAEKAAEKPAEKAAGPAVPVKDGKEPSTAQEAKGIVKRPLIDLPPKPAPNATPQEVAARIAEKLAILRAERAEKTLREVQVRSAGAAPVRRRAAPTTSAASTAAPTGALAMVAAGATARAPAAAQRDAHWSYGGDAGPLRWAEMNPEWAKCGNGSRQSPIDIRSGIKVDLEPIAFDYKPSGFSVIDNGHTVQVNLGAGNHITVSGRMYELVQFHFHRPSEEKINGRAFEMVAHLVHKDATGKLAVVAVLIERGAARNLVQTVWNNLPLEKNEAVNAPGALDMNGILPGKRDYYTYMGSLTTPPCSEGVLWLVMKEPVTVSQDQLDIFARLYQMNARPIQLSAERLIKESN